MHKLAEKIKNNPKGIFPLHGGVKVPHNKNTRNIPSVMLPPPAEIVLPMQQHIGVTCSPVVKKGDYVYAGQVVGDSDAYVSAPIHSSVSGTVKEITQVMLTAGQMVDAIVIESDGKMQFHPDIKAPPEIKTREQLYKAARSAGLVGLGGAGFPAHVKLNVSEETEIHTLIVNAAECEPYVTSDHREALENSFNVLAGIQKIKEILHVKHVIIAVEDNKPEVISCLSDVAEKTEKSGGADVKVMRLKSIYPQGAEKVMVKACANIEIPAGKIPADVGCLVMNIGSVSFLASYMRTGKPLTLKRITVDGSAVTSPQNVIVPIGTKISEVIEFCGGYKSVPQKIIMGGPMMGIAITSDEMPVIKQNNAILAFDAKESKLLEPTSCIRCGKCITVCPMNLMPVSFERAAEKKNTEKLKSLDIMTCMECGCCSFVCPAGRRLVQAIRLGKSYLRRETVKK